MRCSFDLTSYLSASPVKFCETLVGLGVQNTVTTLPLLISVRHERSVRRSPHQCVRETRSKRQEQPVTPAQCDPVAQFSTVAGPATRCGQDSGFFGKHVLRRLVSSEQQSFPSLLTQSCCSWVKHQVYLRKPSSQLMMKSTFDLKDPDCLT